MAGRRIEIMDIRELVRHLRATASDRAVQRDTGVDRRTVQRYRAWALEHQLLSGPLPALDELQRLVAATLTASPPPQMVSSVEPFRELVLRLRAEQTEMAAIWARLKEQGFTGSYSAVRRFVRMLEPVTPEPVVRVETAPAEEGQVDFGYAGRMLDPLTGALRRAWAFVMVLSWSRHQYVEFVFDQTVATWLVLHRHAFAFFGGVPKRIVIDNLKAGITQACWEDPQVQRSYRECAEHYGFLIAPCRPRTPEHKGKVEQGGVHYVKRNFLGGRTPTTLTQANAEVLVWCQTTAGARCHGTTKAQPLARFTATERDRLLVLPSAPYDMATWKVATVARDCYVVFEQAFYSVPFRLVGQQVHVRGGSREVCIYTKSSELVATHTRAQEAGERQTHHDHLPPEKLPGLLLDVAACQTAASDIGPATRQVVDQMLSDTAVDRRRMVLRLLRLRETYGDDRLEAACHRAMRFDTATYPTVKRILEQGFDQEAVPPPAPVPPAQAFVRNASELLGNLLGGAKWS
ncbi:MAG: IS21 family transposase [Candidatus Viridilinea halotolerans]|uniref:IS21 family transposase n=1 Tax=Candidatus Viridilinea halotolerans TaxID=2491704 RepID=A0A426UBE4_9CHLR|nr:MAG: IS21 family transposase [Candidatus Viridilinea halotolerans]